MSDVDWKKLTTEFAKMSTALAEFCEVAKKLQDSIQPIIDQMKGESDEELIERLIAENSVHSRPEHPFVCEVCGYGQDDTDLIDWDVMYGHQSCKNQKCPNHQRSDR